MRNTSWEKEADWYDSLVSREGHYYHREVIFPCLFKILNWKTIKNPSILDLGCGQGALGRNIPQNIPYVGVDASPTLIQKAKQADATKLHQYIVSDVTESIPLEKKDFSHAIFLLSLQNIEQPKLALQEAKKHLRKSGQLILVLNHPCFRIPRQSSWEQDERQKIQYRRINRYLTPMKIPIEAHPGKKPKSTLLSFHYPLSTYFHFLKETGFSILDLQEWCSNKKSLGKMAKMENRARSEFPLFLTIVAKC